MSFKSRFHREAARVYNWNRCTGDQRTVREVADDVAACAAKISRYHPDGRRLAAELLTELMFLGEVMGWDIPGEMKARDAAIRDELRILQIGEKH